MWSSYTCACCAARPPAKTNWTPISFSAASSSTYFRKRFPWLKSGGNPFDSRLLRRTISGKVSLRAGASLQSSTIVIGRSAKDNTEEQARQIGDAWEKLGDIKPQFNLEIHLPNGDKIYKVLGPHAPNLTANEVNLLHSLWLRFSDVLAPQELHHHDVVHFALEEVKKEIEEGQEDAVVKRLRITPRRKPEQENTFFLRRPSHRVDFPFSIEEHS